MYGDDNLHVCSQHQHNKPYLTLKSVSHINRSYYSLSSIFLYFFIDITTELNF